MSVSTTTKRWIHLHPAEADALIVTTEDDHTFTLPIDVAIAACGSNEKISRFTKQLQDVLQRLAKWLQLHQDDVQDAYVTFRDAGLLFLLVRKSRPFNDRLEDSLTDLDIELAQDSSLDLIKLRVLALPQTSEEGVNSFLATPFVFQYAK